jgi:hypothetical protein
VLTTSVPVTLVQVWTSTAAALAAALAIGGRLVLLRCARARRDVHGHVMLRRRRPARYVVDGDPRHDEGGVHLICSNSYEPGLSDRSDSFFLGGVVLLCLSPLLFLLLSYKGFTDRV